MTAATLEGVRALARLARLSLTEEELGLLVPELGRILEAFEVLARHGTAAERGAAEEGTPVAAQAGPSGREDEPVPSLDPAVLLAAAPASQDGFYVVPKTIGGAG